MSDQSVGRRGEYRVRHEDREQGGRGCGRCGAVRCGAVRCAGRRIFPAFLAPGNDTASALAAECLVVIKGAPAHPETSLRYFDALSRAAWANDVLKGLLGLVTGSRRAWT